MIVRSFIKYPDGTIKNMDDLTKEEKDYVLKKMSENLTRVMSNYFATHEPIGFLRDED